MFINFLTCILFGEFGGKFWFIHSRAVLLYSHPRQERTNKQKTMVVVLVNEFCLVYLVICRLGYCRCLCGHTPTSPTTHPECHSQPYEALPCVPLHTLPPKATWNKYKMLMAVSAAQGSTGTPTVHLYRSPRQPALLPSHCWPLGTPPTHSRPGCRSRSFLSSTCCTLS